MASSISPENLRKKLGEFEEGIKAIRYILALHGEAAVVSAAKRANTTMRAAFALDAQRRGNGGVAPASKRRQQHLKGYNTKAAKAARRREAALLLGKFDRKTPRSAKGLGRGAIGNLVMHKFLRVTPDGILRTAKPFPLDTPRTTYTQRSKVARTPRIVTPVTTKKKTKKAKWTNSALRAQREKTAAFLSQFGPEPTVPNFTNYKKAGIGPLVRREYLGRGGRDAQGRALYFSTGKVYVV